MQYSLKVKNILFLALLEEPLSHWTGAGRVYIEPSLGVVEEMMLMDQTKALVIFQDKKIRRIWHKEEWWYSVVDIIGVLAESEDPRTYWKVLKHRLIQEGGDQVVTNCNQLKLPAEDGKLRETDCAPTKTLLRLIQSIPSKKAEPFKQWLAEIGQERIQEIENPELAQDRVKKYYEFKGYPKEWIEKRLRGIAIRQDLILTDTRPPSPLPSSPSALSPVLLPLHIDLSFSRRRT